MQHVANELYRDSDDYTGQQFFSKSLLHKIFFTHSYCFRPAEFKSENGFALYALVFVQF